jgi:oligopeptide transport system substrate-binding protein
MDWANPENPLIPANTTEVQGGKVVDALFTGLINYDTKTGALVLANAESMTPDATSTTYTVKLKSGWKWHDGTPVVAQDYVDAWNDASYAPNGMSNGTFFADIKGWDDLNPADPDGDGPLKAPDPTVKTMSGLKVVDDSTFTVTLNGPSNLWPLKTGYSAFMPLPKAYFADKAAFGKAPIGNGPFKFVSWTENTELKITRFDDYQGPDKPKIKDVTFRVYQEDTAAYADVQAGTLDFQQQVPSADLPNNQYQTDFPGHFVNQPVATSNLIDFPFYLKEFQNLQLREAISVAIDRKSITDRIYNGSRVPSDSWSNPEVAGYQAHTCQFCTYDAAKAKQLLKDGNVTVNADGSFISNGVTVPELTIQYNADASHKAWVEATCASIQTATGIKCEGKPIPTFAEHRTIIDAHQATSLFRAAWQADYPSIEDWLNPLLRTGGSSNDGLYSNAALDAALAKADSTKDQAAANALYQDAEKMAAADMPTIPLWHYAQQSVWGSRLKTVPINIFGELDLSGVELA